MSNPHKPKECALSQLVIDRIYEKYNNGTPAIVIGREYNMEEEDVIRLIGAENKKKREKRDPTLKLLRIEQTRIKMERARMQWMERANEDGKLCENCCWKPCDGAPCCYKIKFGMTPDFRPFKIICKKK